jgi:hypothetical protein
VGPHQPGSPDPVRSSRWRGALAWVQRRRQLSPRARGALLFVAAVGTIVAAVIAVRSLELSFADLRWGPLVAAGVAITPATIVLNAFELRVLGQLTTGRRDAIASSEATRTVVLASAANLLPVPAGALLRVQLLHRAGATVTKAAVATTVAAGAWIGAALLITAAGLLSTQLVASGVAAGLGVASLVASVGVLRSVGQGRWRAAVGRLLLVEFATAALQVVRLWLVVRGLGEVASVAQAAVIGAASPIAAAAGFFPGGIGLAELLSAILAPLAGMSAAVALLATGVARLLGLLVTAPLAMAMGLRDVSRTVPAPEDPAPGARSRE